MGDSLILRTHKAGSKIATGVIGVRINLNDSNPATRCEYTDDLEGLTPASWTATTNGKIASSNPVLTMIRKVCNFRSCHIAAGDNKVYKYLRPDDWRYYEDGSSAAANMASTGYNTFTEFPHFFISIVKQGSYLYVRAANKKIDNTFSDWPFRYNGTVRERHYIGSFLCDVDGNKMHSRANIAPAVSVSMANFRTYARAQGTGYDMWMFSSLVILQVLYLMAFCHTNSQEAVCPGYTGGSAKQNTGLNYNAAYGEFYRSDVSATSRFRIFGIEDLWGNLYEYCSNIFTVGTTLYVTDYNTADNAGSTLATKTFSANYGGYIQTVMGETYFPFVVAEGGASGSATTYYCDYGAVYSGCVAVSGGSWSYGAYAGVFRLDVTDDGGGYGNFGSRLVFLCPEVYNAA